jgi:hypothetical protein
VHPARREGAARSSIGRSSIGRASVGRAAAVHALRLDPADSPVEPRAPKHLRVAPTPSKRVLRQRRRARYAIAGVAAISALSMFLLVTFHVFAVGASFKLDKLEHERADAQRQNELLRNRVARLSSATRIFTSATRLGYVMGNPALINVSNSDAMFPSSSAAPVTMPPTDPNAVVANAP